jgi:copper chaperone
MTDSAASARLFSVPAISCDHCKNAIESSVGDVNGVDVVNVDIGAKTVTVTGGDDADIVEAIDRAGYDVA